MNFLTASISQRTLHIIMLTPASLFYVAVCIYALPFSLFVIPFCLPSLSFLWRSVLSSYGYWAKHPNKASFRFAVAIIALIFHLFFTGSAIVFMLSMLASSPTQVSGNALPFGPLILLFIIAAQISFTWVCYAVFRDYYEFLETKATAP